MSVVVNTVITKTETEHNIRNASGLYQFLLQFKTEKTATSAANFTHTSFARPSGAFYIPGHRMDEFFALYKLAVKKGENLYITEKHRVIGPVIVDLDFRFDVSTSGEEVRRYTPKHVDDFVKAYCKELVDVVDVDDFDVYVLEKSSGPTVHKSLVKDGLHLTIPGVVTRPVVQHLVRDRVLPKMAPIFADMDVRNRMEDILDEAIIDKNNWLMYMSKKPNGTPYEVTRVLKYSKKNKDTIVDVTAARLLTPDAMIDLLSIRNKFEESPIHEEFQSTVSDIEQQAEEKKKRKALVQTIISNTPNNADNVCDNLDVVLKLCDILDPVRGTTYNDWVRLGWCFRNVDHRLLDKWIEISKKSPKYIDGECARMWEHMRMGGLTIGTLHMWARTDSPGRYKEIVRSDLATLINKSATGAHYDIACVVFQMYRYEYVCASIRFKTWYEFRDHRWSISDSACSLRRKMSTNVFEEYTQAALHHQSMAANGGGTDQEVKVHIDMCKTLNSIALKLKDANFKDNVIRECCEMFYHEKFEEKLDSNCGLLGFVNGVFDLDEAEFREGRPDDLISFSTGINYKPFSEDMEHIADIRKFWSQVLPNPGIREYVLTLLSSFISGHTREEKFHIWTGSGCHAPGTPILMHHGGTRNVEDIIIGDVLMGEDGSGRTVIKLHGGFSDMYSVTSPCADFEEFVVNGGHIMTMVTENDEVVDMPLIEYLASGENYYMYRPSAPLEFVGYETSQVPDGLAYEAGFTLDLDTYNFHPSAARFAVLAGTIDAFGHLDKATYVVHFRSTSLNWVVRSLGLTMTTDDHNTYISGDNVRHIPSRIFSVDVVGVQFKNIVQFKNRVPFSVSRVRDGPYYGFELDKPTFLFPDFLVQHNSNGKSLSVELYDKALGDYTCKFPVTLLTGKRAASNSATSEIARAKGRRFACLQEPSESERLNVGLMKELTGGDKIQARAIYKEPVEFKPQWHIALLCNHLPAVPSDDGGTWRRIRVVEFTSKFVDKPEKAHEFPVDLELSKKVEDWKEPFMSMLIDYYLRLGNKKIKEPDEVTQYTREYQKNNDHYADFFDTYIEEIPQDERSDCSGDVHIAEAFEVFRAWVKADAIPITVPTKKDLLKYLDRALFKSVQKSGMHTWPGYRIKMMGGNDFLKN